MSRVDVEYQLQQTQALLAEYDAPPPAAAAAMAFARAELEAYASGRKSRCFIIVPAAEAAAKAGGGGAGGAHVAILFRDAQHHHCVFAADGSKHAGLSMLWGDSVSDEMR